MAAITSAVVGIGSAVMAKRSADKQTKAMQQGNDASIAEQRRQYDQAREDFAPYREWGISGMNALNDPLANFEASPGYEWRRNEGMRDIGNQFAVKGGGGNAMKALAAFNQNYASNEFGNWWQRQMQKVDVGRGATNSVSAAGQNMANNVSAGYQSLGANTATVRGNQYANMNNALNAGISNILFAKYAGI